VAQDSVPAGANNDGTYNVSFTATVNSVLKTFTVSPTGTKLSKIISVTLTNVTLTNNTNTLTNQAFIGDELTLSFGGHSDSFTDVYYALNSNSDPLSWIGPTALSMTGDINIINTLGSAPNGVGIYLKFTSLTLDREVRGPDTFDRKKFATYTILQPTSLTGRDTPSAAGTDVSLGTLFSLNYNGGPITLTENWPTEIGAYYLVSGTPTYESIKVNDGTGNIAGRFFTGSGTGDMITVSGSVGTEYKLYIGGNRVNNVPTNPYVSEDVKYTLTS
jgi:hypothetical protein